MGKVAWSHISSLLSQPGSDMLLLLMVHWSERVTWWGLGCRGYWEIQDSIWVSADSELERHHHNEKHCQVLEKGPSGSDQDSTSWGSIHREQDPKQVLERCQHFPVMMFITSTALQCLDHRLHRVSFKVAFSFIVHVQWLVNSSLHRGWSSSRNHPVNVQKLLRPGTPEITPHTA